MKKPTITQKRATLFREWLLAILANNESYYDSTLMMGIPDGDTEETVLEDLQDGFYDDDIDETIQVYLDAKAAYGSDGYYVFDTVYMNEDEALEAAAYAVPDRIYKR